MPGSLFNAGIHRPLSSEIDGNPVIFRAFTALITEFSIKVLPFSFGSICENFLSEKILNLYFLKDLLFPQLFHHYERLLQFLSYLIN